MEKLQEISLIKNPRQYCRKLKEKNGAGRDGVDDDVVLISDGDEDIIQEVEVTKSASSPSILKRRKKPSDYSEEGNNNVPEKIRKVLPVVVSSTSMAVTTTSSISSTSTAARTYSKPKRSETIKTVVSNPTGQINVISLVRKVAWTSRTAVCMFCNCGTSISSMNMAINHKDVEVLKFLCEMLKIDFEVEFLPRLESFPCCELCWMSYNDLFTLVGGDADISRKGVEQRQQEIEKYIGQIQERRFQEGNCIPMVVKEKDLPVTLCTKVSPDLSFGGKRSFQDNQNSSIKIVLMGPRNCGSSSMIIPRTSVAALPMNKSRPLTASRPVTTSKLMTTSKPVITSKSATTPGSGSTKGVNANLSNSLDLDPLEVEAPLDYISRAFSLDHTYCSKNPCLTCEFCDGSFYKLEHLMSHFVSDHNSQPKKYVCLQCGRSFVSTILLNKHMNSHKSGGKCSPIFCDICEQRFTTAEDLHGHLDNHTVIKNLFQPVNSSTFLKCLYCRKKGRQGSFSELRRHELKNHRPELNFKCSEEKCQQPFSHLYLLKAHQVCHRPETNNSSSTSSGSKEETMYPCLVCQFQFNSVKSLQYHLLIHLNFKERSSSLNYQEILDNGLFCKTCGKIFSRKDFLAHHEKTISHAHPKCDFCPEYYFHSQNDLVNHMIERHEKVSTDKPYQCCKSKCGKQFATGFMYKRHLRYHDFYSRCPLCELGMKFFSRANKIPEDIKFSVKTHMSTHHTVESQCQVCSKQFCNRLSLAVHHRQHHPELFTFVCKICDKTYISQEQLDSHSSTHVSVVGIDPDLQLFECHCSKSFISLDKFAEHLATHSADGLLLCDECPNGSLSPSLFRNKESLQIHVQKEHAQGKPPMSPWSISITDYDALIEENMASTNEPVASDDTPSSSTILDNTGDDTNTVDKSLAFVPRNKPRAKAKCTVCDKILKNSTGLRRHEHMHPELFIYNCSEPSCDSKFMSEVHLFTHAQIHVDPLVEPLVCFCCFQTDMSKPFNTKEELLKHLQSHTQDKKTACPVCGKILSDKKHVIEHIASLHDHSLRTIKCSDCPLIFVSKDKLRRHRKAIHSTEIYECPDCDKKYRSSGMLYCHRREIHNPIMQQCDQCGDMIAKSKFKMHLFKRHDINTFNHAGGTTATGRKLVIRNCYFCKKQFDNISQLQYHMARHTQEKPHRCTVCESKFGDVRQYHSHMKRKHPGFRLPNIVLRSSSGAKKKSFSELICKVCGKKYTRPHLFKIHMQFHSGIRPYKCSVCGKGFSNGLSRAGHMLSHRSLDPKEVNRTSATKSFAKTWKPFQCKFCDKLFTVKTQYKYHLNKHTGKLPYKCHICGVRFPHSGWFLGHKKTHMMWGDYQTRPDHMRGPLPESDEEEVPITTTEDSTTDKTVGAKSQPE